MRLDTTQENDTVEQLATEVAMLARESKTEAIRRALEERKRCLELEVVPQALGDRAFNYLEREVWPILPPTEIGRTLTRQEEDEILGYGPEGY